MALAPCLIGYGAIAKRLYTEEQTLREGNRYWKWIENYVAEDYTEAVQLGSGKYLFSLLLRYVMADNNTSRTAGVTHAKDLAKPGGRTHQDLHTSNRIRMQLLGYGIGPSSIEFIIRINVNSWYIQNFELGRDSALIRGKKKKKAVMEIFFR